jgi:hypothetical protein
LFLHRFLLLLLLLLLLLFFLFFFSEWTCPTKFSETDDPIFTKLHRKVDPHVNDFDIRIGFHGNGSYFENCKTWMHLLRWGSTFLWSLVKIGSSVSENLVGQVHSEKKKRKNNILTQKNREQMATDKIGKISMFSDFNENLFLGLFWSEELIGNDENWN